MFEHTQKFVGNLPANCLSVFDHFVGLVLNGGNQGNFLFLIPVKQETSSQEEVGKEYYPEVG